MMTPVEIRKARRKLGLSANQMGAMLETDGRTYRCLEADPSMKTHRRPAPRMVRLLEAYLNGYRPPDWPEFPAGIDG